ncbi:ribosome-associated translation inhibitor RaiA [Pseudoglutamicibacter albus]|uniref:Ribosome hibernation promoting factor n=1 Tax=Pseudoglutamicibacter cumminsii TaxID=156979 RepID=A0AAP4FG53_9MICC|nr:MULTISPECIES: ribosome-associated translation inhibitor RaiA [Pseudoglutamicibacter]MBM7795166.1 ribosomal subunit interface protein [Pseudoglutamicibacter cumminsii]MCT1685592.1 ribosome-associated translation inhibitor RaiA [Pseudoglutamicibacter cumminsii]MDK6274512.1 ribosome-associated translation inhibitor RaiA [Pseudoglutamicibacter cumminsii]MDK7082345.1 ribosome-associated translation inhibitor RaiA [Pseudoglutamicibacter cumminsii]MDZ3745368.1 ribosome-associated translation inhib
MDVNVIGRNVSVTDRFREYVEDRAAKVEQLSPRAQTIDIKVSRQPNARVADSEMTVEVTVIGPGPAVRAEAHSSEKFSAFDLAFAKLLERLRRARDKAKDHRRNDRALSQPIDPESVPASDKSLLEQVEEARRAEEVGDVPVEIRRKRFPAVPMTEDDAVDNMELVGHPFYLFLDSETGLPSLVYRRRGWSYGVIALDENLTEVSKDGIKTYRS